MKPVVETSLSREVALRARRACALAIAAALATPAGAVETAILLSPTPSATAEMAYAVGVDGTRVALGAPGEAEVAGALYLSDCATSPCTLPLRIAPVDLAAHHAFGTAVGIDGDTLIATAPGADPGAVYVFVANGGSWTQQAKLTATGGTAGERFGIAASISGERIAVGADRDATSGGGAVYVFLRNGTAWTQEARLTPSDAAPHDAFGTSVALDGDTLLAGAPGKHRGSVGSYANGAAYVFVRGGGGWAQQAKLADAAGANGEMFGLSVDLAGGRAVIGAPFAAADQGHAWLYTGSGSAWTQQAELSAAGGAPGDQFGWSVALGDDAVFVGAPFAGTLAGAACGGSYMFDTAQLAQSGTGAIEAPLLDDLSGWSIAASGTRWVSSAPGHLVGDIVHAGAAYWFDPLVTLFHAGFDVDGACVAPDEDDEA
ncbi:MAG: hypothetical protein ABW186_03535 [Rhodanobacteraceae bacterium]